LLLTDYKPVGVDPSNEKTYDFFKDVFSEIAPAYACSPNFMLNCDEVFFLEGSQDAQGNLNAKLDKMIKEVGTGGMYAYHINRLADMLKKYGKRAMIWADSPLLIF